MLELHQTLSYYKRKDVQKLILEYAKDKEIGTRFNESFGKRPDTLNYENDIMELAKRGATSFHCSEELWNNPLRLSTELKKNEIEDLRKGWDLILDIDCPFWTFSKLVTYVFIKALKDHGINAVTVKFSGGKGFHIAVPFEVFPEKNYYLDGKYVEVRNLFPEGPRKIGTYLLHYVNNELVKAEEDKLVFGKASVSYDVLEKETGRKRTDMIIMKCSKCDKQIKEQQDKVEYICPICDLHIIDKDKEYVLCPKCKKLMTKKISKKTLCDCGSNKAYNFFDLSNIVAIDTILISTRHLYRMPYSLHEKTGLVSIPFDIKKILKFEKSDAETKKIKPFKFLNREEAKIGEGEALLLKSLDFQEKRYEYKDEKNTSQKKYSELDMQQSAIPEEFFPPCIQKISLGMEDGKKRALFILINFLSSVGWEYEQIEEYLLKWNERNPPDRLKDTYVKGQLRYYRQQKEKLPPPNCDNRGYMIDTGFCNPDSLCKRIKNPVQYAKRKAYLTNNSSKTRKPVIKNKE